MAFCHSALTGQWKRGLICNAEPSGSGRASAGLGPRWDRAGHYDSGKELDVNLIHIYKKNLFKVY